MKTKVLLRSLLLSLLLGGYPAVGLALEEPPVRLAQLQQEWQQFSDQQGGFTVLMPVTPIPKKQTQSSPFGSIDLYSFTASLESGSITYFVSYSDLPSDVAQLPPKLFLDSLRSSFTNNSRVELLEQQDITLGNHPGKEFKLELPGRATIRHRAYLVEQRLYQVVTATPLDRGDELASDVEKFLNSFQLL